LKVELQVLCYISSIKIRWPKIKFLQNLSMIKISYHFSFVAKCKVTDFKCFAKPIFFLLKTWTWVGTREDPIKDWFSCGKYTYVRAISSLWEFPSIPRTFGSAWAIPLNLISLKQHAKIHCFTRRVWYQRFSKE